MSTLKEIAKKLNVSPMTVSNVINGRFNKVSQDTRVRVEKAIEEANYQPNLSARSLVSKRSMIIILAITQSEDSSEEINSAMQNPFYSELIRFIEYELREKGYFLMLRFMSDSQSVDSLLNKWNAEGVILIGECSEEIKNIKKPVVLVDNYKYSSVNTVNTEDYDGLRLGIQYLIDQGHKDIAYVSSKISDKDVASERYRGFVETMEKNNLKVNKDWVFEGDPDYNFGKQVGIEIAKNKIPVTAVYCHSDLLGIAVSKGLQKHGIVIPKDISIISFDGLILSTLAQPELTTISQDIKAKGQGAVELLISQIDNKNTKPKKIKIPVELKVRNSVKKIK